MHHADSVSPSARYDGTSSPQRCGKRPLNTLTPEYYFVRDTRMRENIRGLAERKSTTHPTRSYAHYLREHRESHRAVSRCKLGISSGACSACILGTCDRTPQDRGIVQYTSATREQRTKDN